MYSFQIINKINEEFGFNVKVLKNLDFFLLVSPFSR